MKPRLSFYTNIPSPYNLDLFEALSIYFNLQVIYYSSIESGRLWAINTESLNYKSTILETNFIGKLFQKFKSEFHFSSGILRYILFDKSDSIILGGNYFSPNTYIVLITARLKNKKIYWFGERLLPIESTFKKHLKYLLLLPVFRFCHGILCVGNAAIDSYKSYGYKGNCYNIPYSINDSFYNKLILDSDKFNKLENLLNPTKKLIILTSGSLIQRKGVDNAIIAYLNLPIEIKNKTKLWILGDGPLRDELESLDDKSGEIHFLGFIAPEILPYYFNMSSLFLFCSRYDGWAVVINEALSAGLPVIVSNKVTASELIKNDVNGYVCNSDNIDNYIESLVKILSSESLRNKISIENKNLSILVNSNNTALKIYKILH